jgi:Neural proliferation differentiation control-1 protein (NPDC1)
MFSLGRMESLIDIDDEEEDDNTIYECPGLAPPGEMVVTNPFFLSRELDQLANSSPPHLLPCPVNNNNNIKHGNININSHYNNK